MERVTYDPRRVSGDIESLTTDNLKRAYKRYKATTSNFRNTNLRDPLDYIDFEVNLHAEVIAIKEEVDTGNYFPKRPQVHFAPKKLGISRPTVSLKIEDAVVYRFCIEQMDEDLVRITRQKNIHGGVMASPVPEPEDGEYYEKWFEDWLQHNKAVHEALNDKQFIGTSDISSYFDNVNIDLLIESLRETIIDKPNLVDFLAFFLHNVKLRYGYGTTLNTGLVQDDTDCSRILAYFYLHPHDLRMIKFCKTIDADFFRFVDDMNIVAHSETDAKLAMRELTNSLRQLGLMASIEKTQINSRTKALELMMTTQNETLSNLEDRISYALNYDEDVNELKTELIKLYEAYKSTELHLHGSWIKILRRFYTLGTRLQSDYLLDDLEDHLARFPDLVANRKLQKYLYANSNNKSIDSAIERLLKYLDSAENLYPQTETEAIELLASFDLSKLNSDVRTKLEAWSYAKEFDSGAKALQSDFARGINLFLLYKLRPSINTQIAIKFIDNISHQSDYLRRCFALISLTIETDPFKKKVLGKCRTYVSSDMKRLVNFVEQIDVYATKKTITNYKKRDTISIYATDYINSKGDPDFKNIKVKYSPARLIVLEALINAHLTPASASA